MGDCFPFPASPLPLFDRKIANLLDVGSVLNLFIPGRTVSTHSIMTLLSKLDDGVGVALW